MLFNGGQVAAGLFPSHLECQLLCFCLQVLLPSLTVTRSSCHMPTLRCWRQYLGCRLVAFFAQSAVKTPTTDICHTFIHRFVQTRSSPYCPAAAFLPCTCVHNIGVSAAVVCGPPATANSCSPPQPSSEGLCTSTCMPCKSAPSLCCRSAKQLAKRWPLTWQAWWQQQQPPSACTPCSCWSTQQHAGDCYMTDSRCTVTNLQALLDESAKRIHGGQLAVLVVQ